MKYLLLLIALFALTDSVGQERACNPDLNIRRRITNAEMPNAFTCYMEMTRGRSARYGTGFLIHPRVILTVGHNLAWYPTGRVNQVKVYFGSIDSVHYLASDIIKLSKGSNQFYKNNYYMRGKIENDYAIIILPDSSIYKKVGGTYKIADTSMLQNTDLINITGSPGDKDLFEMWTSSTKNFGIQESMVRYDLHTEVRNSGSPIWTKTGSTYYVIGAHSRSWGDCNAAVLINGEVLEQLKRWCKAAGVDF